MSPLNGLMNHVAELSRSENCFTRTVSARAAMILGGIPLEIAATAQNLITLPFQPIGMTCKIMVKVVNFGINSKILKNVEDFLPGLGQIAITAYKIVAYAIGTVFTCVLGLLSPMTNFHLHCALGLIHDEKAEAERMQAEEEEARQHELQEAMIQAKIQTKLFSIRQKAAEQERLRTEEAQRERETQAAISKLAKAEEEKKQMDLSARFITDHLTKEMNSLSARQEKETVPLEIQRQMDKKIYQEIKPLSIDAALFQIIPQNKISVLRRIAALFRSSSTPRLSLKPIYPVS